MNNFVGEFRKNRKISCFTSLPSIFVVFAKNLLICFLIVSPIIGCVSKTRTQSSQSTSDVNKSFFTGNSSSPAIPSGQITTVVPYQEVDLIKFIRRAHVDDRFGNFFQLSLSSVLFRGNLYSLGKHLYLNLKEEGRNQIVERRLTKQESRVFFRYLRKGGNIHIKEVSYEEARDLCTVQKKKTMLAC